MNRPTYTLSSVSLTGILIGCAVLLMVFAGCKREELPADEDNAAILGLEGRLDGQAFRLYAGEGQVYQDATLEKDELDVTTYGGTFITNQDLIPSPGQVRIRIRGVEEGELTNALPARNYPFRGEHTVTDPDPFAFRLTARSDGQRPYTYEWVEEDGLSLVGAEPILKSPQTQVHKIKLHLADANGCRDIALFELMSGDQYCPKPFFFNYEKGADGNITFHPHVDTTTRSLTHVIWTFGDGGYRFNELAPSYQYNYTGIYGVKAVVIDDQGCMSCDFQNVYTKAGPSCASSIMSRTIGKDKDVGKVTVDYWNDEGRLFTTDMPIKQPENSSFDIQAVSPFEVSDPDGDATALVEATFTCRLFARDGTGDFVDMEIDQATFGVGR
ncbi:MAG: PKD domain-containing protein [Bacteroidota bacterium]